MISALQAVQTSGVNSANGFDSLLKAGSGMSVSDGTPFGDLIKEAVGKINQLEDQARNTIDGLMLGNGVDVHKAMIAGEKASMAFELALAVRNKAVQSYQTVMSMQF